MSSIKYLILLFLLISLGSCSFDSVDSELIETKTTLTTIEISNYLPTSTSTNSLSNGYTKMSCTKMGLESYSSFKEEFGKADTKNQELYFDSTDYSFLKNIQKSSLLTTDQINKLISDNQEKFNLDYPDLSIEKLKLVSVISKLDKGIIITLEVPEDNTLNWSIVKLWTIDKEKSRPQIHSVLFAKANNFDSIGFDNTNSNNSVLLKEDNFVYRLVLNNEIRFYREMDIYVSMFTENAME